MGSCANATLRTNKVVISAPSQEFTTPLLQQAPCDDYEKSTRDTSFRTTNPFDPSKNPVSNATVTSMNTMDNPSQMIYTGSDHSYDSDKPQVCTRDNLIWKPHRYYLRNQDNKDTDTCNQMSSTQSLYSDKTLGIVISYFFRTSIEPKNDNKTKAIFPIEVEQLIEDFAIKLIGCAFLTDAEESAFIQLLSTKLPNMQQKEFELIYTASENDFSGNKFYKAMEHREWQSPDPTITILENEFGNIFGGYTSIRWAWSVASGRYHTDPTAFLFTIRQLQSGKEDQMRIIELKDAAGHQAVYHNACYGPVFGDMDLKISGSCNKRIPPDEIIMMDYSRTGCGQGNVYDHDGTMSGGQAKHGTYVGMAPYYFSIKEYQVFAIVDVDK